MKSTRDETTKKLVGVELDSAILMVVMDGNVSGLRELLDMYDDVMERDIFNGRKALHVAGKYGHVDVAKLLIQYYASYYAKSVPLILELLCFGAKIDKNALKWDKTGLLVPIEERLEKLRNGEYRITNMRSKEENEFMWSLAFCLTLKAKVPAFKVYHKVCSFITFKGIFMAPKFKRGWYSIWKMTAAEICKKFGTS